MLLVQIHLCECDRLLFRSPYSFTSLNLFAFTPSLIKKKKVYCDEMFLITCTKISKCILSMMT